jgi:pyrroline-5-carboxylate reductase
MDRIQHSIRSLQVTSSESQLSMPKVTVRLQDQNGRAAQEADIVILGCKSYAFEDILGDQGVRKGLLGSGKSKTLVSILGGVTIAQLQGCLYESEHQKFTGTEHCPSIDDSKRLCTIVRAIPNMAACNQESMTVLSSAHLSTRLGDEERQANRLFALLGPTKSLPETQMNHASALAASSLAFYANIISATADGALDSGNGEGLSREDAMWISAQAARGVSGLLVAGQNFSDVVADVATKGGSTAAGLKVMEERGVGEAVTAAVKECARATERLSNADKGNGMRCLSPLLDQGAYEETRSCIAR